MTKSLNPPAHLHDLFRQELLARNGAFGLSALGSAEELKRFRFYLETFEQFVSNQEAGEIQSLKDKAESLSEEQQNEFLEWYYPAHWDEIFRSNFRASFVVSQISFIEVQLSQVCRDVAVIANALISWTDLKGSILERAKLFLSKFGGFHQPTSDQWNEVLRINDVRNVIVHHGGQIDDYNHANRLRQFMKIQPGLSASNGFLIVGSEFCPFALSTAENFFQSVSIALAALCARVRQFESRPLPAANK